MAQQDWRDKKSIKDLLEELETAEDPEVDLQDYSDDVVPFLLKYGIKPGDNSIKATQLYKLYRSYSKYPLTRSDFSRIIGVHIPSFSNIKGNWYKINIESFRISELTHKQLFKRKVHKTKVISSIRHFDDICRRLNLTKGSVWVEGFIIYEVYRKYCKYTGKRQLLGYQTLHDFLRLSFDFRRRVSDQHLWFRINDDCKKYLTEEEVKEIRRRRRKSKK